MYVISQKSKDVIKTDAVKPTFQMRLIFYKILVFYSIFLMFLTFRRTFSQLWNVNNVKKKKRRVCGLNW